MPRENTKKKKYERQGNERAKGYSYDPTSPDVVLHNPVTDWWDSNYRSLDNAWNGRMDSERDFYFQSMLQTIPGINGLFSANWNKNALEHYMQQYGFSWQDLISRNVFGGQFGNGAQLRSTVNFVGDMVKQLYT